MDQLEMVKSYYGEVLQSKQDLKTTACCPGEALPQHLKSIVAKVHETVRARFYGCGVPIPAALEGAHVLDLGAGSGRDCFVLSPLVGERGQVIGVDMTPEQVDVARSFMGYHQDVFRLPRSNVRFEQGYIEDLAAAGIADNSVDVVISNCVINLSPAKEQVFREIFRCLKPGGELYFSDVYVDRRLPEALQQDQVLLGECLGGALYKEDLRRLLQKVGCQDPRVVAQSEIQITNPEVKAKTGGARFYSITLRAFKLPLEDRCEDYGQVAIYKGTIAHHPHSYSLDDHHDFIANKPMLVCSNTAAMLSQTRFAEHFEVQGSCDTHFGLFDCASPGAEVTAAGCC